MTDRLAAVGLRLLAPRAVLLGPGNEDALQNLDTTNLPDGSLVWVNDQLAVYALHKQSSAPPSGVTIVQPASGPGRWIPLATTTSGGATIVADIATLEALAAPVAGAQAYVLSVRSGWTFEFGSTLTADGISIVADNGATGKWVRSTSPDRSWAYQAAWFIDGTSGDDENVGSTAPTALKTAAELERRIDGQTLHQKTVVTQLTDLNEWVKLTLKFVDSAADTQEFQWLGGALTSLHTGQISAVTALAPNTNVPEKIADGALVWGPYIGRRVRLTDGAHVGATAWIVKDEGAGVARCSNFQVFDPAAPSDGPALVQPAANDHYQIDQMVSLNGLDLRVSRLTSSSSLIPAAFVVDSIDFGRGLASPYLSEIYLEPDPWTTTGIIARCHMACRNLADRPGSLLFEVGCCGDSGAVAFNRSGQIAISGGATLGSFFTGSLCYHKIGGYHIVQGGQLRVGACVIDVNGGVQVFDAGVSTDGVIVFDGGSQLTLSYTATSPVSGSGNGGAGIKVWGGNSVQHFGTLPTITGSTPGTNDLSLCNTAPTNYSWAAVAAAPNKSVADATRLTGLVQR